MPLEVVHIANSPELPLYENKVYLARLRAKFIDNHNRKLRLKKQKALKARNQQGLI